nr:helix-turn-helix transcriptional regulator [Haloferula luteola]
MSTSIKAGRFTTSKAIATGCAKDPFSCPSHSSTESSIGRIRCFRFLSTHSPLSPPKESLVFCPNEAQISLVDKIPPFQWRNPHQLIRQVGQRIRAHRKARGWTQAELSERAGVSLSTLKLLEREGKGSLQRLAKIAVALDLDGSLRELFSQTPEYASLEEVEATHRPSSKHA